MTEFKSTKPLLRKLDTLRKRENSLAIKLALVQAYIACIKEQINIQLKINGEVKE